jgi:integrase-like protein
MSLMARTDMARGLRFHDLRHRTIAEMAKAGASDATVMAVAGHMSRRMLEHYSHVRMAAKRLALEKLESGLMSGPSVTSQPSQGTRIETLRHNPHRNNSLHLFPLFVSA